MTVETIRLIETDRDLLNRIKRSSGIKNWNVLCRWAFCLSLQDPGPTSVDPTGNWSNVEMSWKVFGGQHADVYWAALQIRAHEDSIPNTHDELEREFHRHLHRGIGMLANLSNRPTVKEIIALTS